MKVGRVPAGGPPKVETMGLEPTTPCLQTKITRIPSDADGLKVLVTAFC